MPTRTLPHTDYWLNDYTRLIMFNTHRQYKIINLRIPGKWMGGKRPGRGLRCLTLICVHIVVGWFSIVFVCCYLPMPLFSGVPLVCLCIVCVHHVFHFENCLEIINRIYPTRILRWMPQRISIWGAGGWGWCGKPLSARAIEQYDWRSPRPLFQLIPIRMRHGMWRRVRVSLSCALNFKQNPSLMMITW